MVKHIHLHLIGANSFPNIYQQNVIIRKLASPFRIIPNPDILLIYRFIFSSFFSFVIINNSVETECLSLRLLLICPMKCIQSFAICFTFELQFTILYAVCNAFAFFHIFENQRKNGINIHLKQLPEPIYYTGAGTMLCVLFVYDLWVNSIETR